MDSKETRQNSKASLFLVFVVVTLVVAFLAYNVLGYVFEKRTNAKDDISNFGDFAVHVLDVGNADCIFIKSGENTMLIDAGENKNEDKIISFLKQQRVKKLDVVIATHPDADHIGSMDSVIENFEIGNFIMPIMPEDLTPTTRTYLDLLTALKDNGLKIERAKAGMAFNLGDAKVSLLWPEESDLTSNNNYSVVCKIIYGNNSFLFMGDAEKDIENYLLSSGIDLKADVLKAGHHGSRTSSTEKFVNAVSPTITLITAGQGNSYGHPHPDVIKTLENISSKIYRNDLDGKISIVSDGDEITVATEK